MEQAIEIYISHGQYTEIKLDGVHDEDTAYPLDIGQLLGEMSGNCNFAS